MLRHPRHAGLRADDRRPRQVVDGDTVVVAGTAVRLKGIDAAERPTLLGEAARLKLMSIVGNASGVANSGELTCRLTGEKNRRREIGYCTARRYRHCTGPHCLRLRLGVPSLRRPLRPVTLRLQPAQAAA